MLEIIGGFNTVTTFMCLYGLNSAQKELGVSSKTH